MEKTVYKEYVKDKINILELIAENQSLGFEVTGKKDKEDIKWFLKKKLVKRRKHKGNIYYLPDMENEFIKANINLFNICLTISIKEQIKKYDRQDKNTKRKADKSN